MIKVGPMGNVFYFKNNFHKEINEKQYWVQTGNFPEIHKITFGVSAKKRNGQAIVNTHTHTLFRGNIYNELNTVLKKH